MTSFTLIQEGDTVLDQTKQKHGIVKSIEYTSNTAVVKVDGVGTNEVMVSKLSSLTKIDKRSTLENNKESVNLKVQIKYFNKELTKITKIEQGDWIDLRTAESITLKKGEYALIPLGVGMKLPDGYEAIVAPRSSTFKNFGIIETNSIGIIDNSYSGDADEWKFPAYALRDTTINFDERICQFRIQKRMPKLTITEVEELDEVSRGGIGSTGIK